MKKMLLLTLLLSLAVMSCKQENKEQISSLKEEKVDQERYKLFPTENIWTFLKLDTRNGRIWQVHYSLNENNRGEVKLNGWSLVSEESAENGRFTLYPTENMYNFILLDQFEGTMWQVQWSMEEEYRAIVPLQE